MHIVYPHLFSYPKTMVSWAYGLCIITTVLAALACEATRESEWRDWKLRYNKQYSPEEGEIRMKIWFKNREYVHRHNNRANVSYTLELNQYADEAVRKTSFKIEVPVGMSTKSNDIVNEGPPPPASWDWRQKGIVSPVRNQGMMGDVGAIVVTECVESYHAIHTGHLVSLSVAEAYDCCIQSMLISTMFDCVHNIGGLCSQQNYPTSMGTCHNKTCTAAAKVNGGKSVPRGNEEQLKMAVFLTPVFAAIDASHPSFQLYKAGIYDEPNCSASLLDHVIQVVGYGSMDGKDFWICQNSWGTSWGMQGYILMSRNKNNQCGIASAAEYPY
ncbi:hypothetical protein CHS0354_022475 [Potamilus streckersoni]|uniref:Uncharacterized protein n=1 Tax=Potamilus streckersoni TaxID=2493646 RepID=A0AAE0W4F8_9BIVA|nr:hypothetical protein CHS0354_022475 [Potamilus streckersoni]